MRNAIASILAAAALSHALVGEWTSYTFLEEIRDLEGGKGSLFAATSGGIRRIDPKGVEKVYRNTEGLRDVGIAALAASPEGDVYATSELGYVYKYDAGADDWDILGTSYKGAGWRMSTRALLYRSGYLVLGSDKGLSFFNVKKKVADANVTKMGSERGLYVNSVTFIGDTLFAGTNRGIYRAVLHLEKLLTDPQTNIFNPSIWTPVAGTPGTFFFRPEHKGDDSGYTQDSLHEADSIAATGSATEIDPSLFSHGMLYYGPDGIGSEYVGASIPEMDTRVSKHTGIRIEGKTVEQPYVWDAIARVGGRWFVGGAGLYGIDPATSNFTPYYNPETKPKEGFTSIRANRHGVYALATPFVYTLQGKIWTPVEGLVVYNSAGDIRIRGQHAFDVLGPQRIYTGTWGFGFHSFQNGVGKSLDAVNSCLPSADGPNYPVVWSQAVYRDKGIWMTIFAKSKPYQIAYYSFATETATCFEPNTVKFEGRNIQVVGDSVLAVVTERSLEAYRIKDNGASVTLEPANLLSRLDDPVEETLAGKADRRGNYWITTEGSTLIYVPAIFFADTAKQTLKSLDGFSGTACKSLELDPQGHLWAGCTEGGVYEITPGRDSLAHAFRKYGLNDGLLSETIYHLDVNADNGDIWVATEKGLARYESASRPSRSNLSSLKVYPNPFLAKHSSVVFSGLSSGSEVRVTTQSGSVVFFRSLTSNEGDQIRWDGRNQAGQRVREGVYFYVVRSPKDVKNGKIIVAR